MMSSQFVDLLVTFFVSCTVRETTMCTEHPTPIHVVDIDICTRIMCLMRKRKCRVVDGEAKSRKNIVCSGVSCA